MLILKPSPESIAVKSNLTEFQFCRNYYKFQNCKTVKAVTLAFCGIQQHSTRDIRVKFGINKSPQSPDIRRNLDGGISDFRIYGQSLIKENRHNSRTSDDIDMKL